MYTGKQNPGVAEKITKVVGYETANKIVHQTETAPLVTITLHGPRRLKMINPMLKLFLIVIALSFQVIAVTLSFKSVLNVSLINFYVGAQAFSIFVSVVTGVLWALKEPCNQEVEHEQAGISDCVTVCASAPGDNECAGCIDYTPAG